MARDWVNLTWREKTWGERAQTVLMFSSATIICLAGTFGILMALGRMIDNADRYYIEHDRCLKQATNGYEIKQCH